MADPVGPEFDENGVVLNRTAQPPISPDDQFKNLIG